MSTEEEILQSLDLAGQVVQVMTPEKILAGWELVQTQIRPHFT